MSNEENISKLEGLESDINSLKVLRELISEYINHSSNNLKEDYCPTEKKRLVNLTKKLIINVVSIEPSIKKDYPIKWDKLLNNSGRLLRKKQFNTMYTKTHDCFIEHLGDIENSITIGEVKYKRLRL